MEYYWTLKERIGTGLPFLVGFDKTVYDSLRESIGITRDKYRGNVQDSKNKAVQRTRLLHLESAANALYEEMRHCESGIIRFSMQDALGKAKTYQEERAEEIRKLIIQQNPGTKAFKPKKVSKELVQRDIGSFISNGIDIKDGAGNIVTWMRFRVLYSTKNRKEHGYIMPWTYAKS